MEGLGLNNDMIVGGRKLHVQTSYSEATGRIVSSVFDDGRIIDKREISYRNGTAPSELRQHLSEVHHQTIRDFETLYYVAEKIRTVRHAGSALRLGRLFLRKRLMEEAISALRLALELDPGLEEARVLLARAFNLRQEPEQARSLLEEALSSGSDSADLHDALGETLFFLKEYAAAAEQFSRALALNPELASAHYYMGLALLAQTEASAEGAAAADDVEAKALEHLQRALQLVPELRTTEVKGAFGLLREGKVAEALERLVAGRPGPFLGPDLSFEDDFYLKFMYGGKGRDDDFIASYVGQLEGVLKDHPDFADLHNNLGIAYLIQCRNLFLKALDEFRQAIKINPNFKRAKKNLKIAENDGKGFLILLRALLK